MTRPWKKAVNIKPIDNPILEITVLHWNVLADFLAYDFEKCPEEYLKWDFRFPMII